MQFVVCSETCAKDPYLIDRDGLRYWSNWGPGTFTIDSKDHHKSLSGILSHFRFCKELAIAQKSPEESEKRGS